MTPRVVLIGDETGEDLANWPIVAAMLGELLQSGAS
jgi:hypothetical protein